MKKSSPYHVLTSKRWDDMKKINISFSRLSILILQVFIIIGIGWISWNILHKTPEIPPDVYPYLTSLPPQLVLDSQKEGEEISKTAWADLLALKSTLPLQQSLFIINQLKEETAFDQISWNAEGKSVSPELIKKVKLRRAYLLNYPLFKPHQYTFPVSGKPWYQDSWGAEREGGKRQHEGTDLFAQEGTPIYNVCAGKIEKLGWNRLGGERVGIRGDDGNYYYYAHLQTIEPSLKIGQKITQGVKIGTMGHTGDALTTPDHLHFGIELPNGSWINPYPFLSVWQHY